MRLLVCFAVQGYTGQASLVMRTIFHAWSPDRMIFARRMLGSCTLAIGNLEDAGLVHLLVVDHLVSCYHSHFVSRNRASSWSICVLWHEGMLLSICPNTCPWKRELETKMGPRVSTISVQCEHQRQIPWDTPLFVPKATCRKQQGYIDILIDIDIVNWHFIIVQGRPAP